MYNELSKDDTGVTADGGETVRIFIFKSEAKPDLRAFSADPAGGQLPKQFGPWRVIGVIAPERDPPHRLSRDTIEAAIKQQGFQLWRMAKKMES
jgi:hypothetical protein